ncbi:hypothetical protein B7463_g11597, partial [Scytalidium lignicola]
MNSPVSWGKHTQKASQTYHPLVSSPDSSYSEDSEVELKVIPGPQYTTWRRKLYGIIIFLAVLVVALGTYVANLHAMEDHGIGPKPIECLCGSSTSEAETLGCKYDSLAACWLPMHCHDDELTAEFEHAGDRPNGEWTYWADSNGTRRMTLEEVGLLANLPKPHAMFYSTFGWHVAHCAFYWRKEFRMRAKGLMLENRYSQLKFTTNMYTKLPEKDFDESSTESLPTSQYTRTRSISLKTFTFRSLRSRFTPERLIILVLLGILIPCLPLAIFSAQCPQQTEFSIKKFGGNTDYMTLDHRKDVLWEALTVNDTSGHGGLIWASDGNLDGKETVGMISMFHQLHCLAGLRMALQASSEGKFVGIDQDDDLHWPHCMDYLRQTLLCNADSTIERPPVINGTLQHFINGADDTRKCGQSALLYDRVLKKGYHTSLPNN